MTLEEIRNYWIKWKDLNKDLYKEMNKQSKQNAEYKKRDSQRNLKNYYFKKEFQRLSSICI